MKRIMVAVAVVGLLGFGAMAPHASAASTFATDQTDNGAVTLTKDETKNGSYYAAAQSVVVDGTVNGDVYCAGQDIYINGTVNGDVLCAGQRVTVRGTVTGDVRTAGQMIEIAGTVGGSVSSFSQQTTIASGAIVKGDLNGGSQFVMINGTVEKDVALGAQELAINGAVKGDVNADVQKIVLSNAPAILGNLSYSSENKLTVNESHVTGTVTYTPAEVETDHNAGSNLAVTLAGFAFMVMIACVVSAVALVALAPRYYERSFALTNKKLGYVLLAGVVMTFSAPLAAVALMLTGVLLPLGILILLAGAVMCLLSFSFVAYYVGRWVFANAVRHSLLVMLAGALILAILMIVPVLNFLVLLAIHILGTGGIIVTVLDGYKKPTYVISVKK